MSTKNLARTVIEGGRTGRNRWRRRQSHGTLRARERQAFARLQPGDGREDFVAPARVVVRRKFADKLGPPQRWLDRQVGRPWDVVHGELLARFDPRTTAGRHIVFDHMLHWVRTSEPIGRRSFWFLVDRHGILRRAPDSRRRWTWPNSTQLPLPRPQQELVDWLAGRRVGARGDILFWFSFTPRGAYRQEHRLTAEDAALWRSLPEWFRERHDPTAPPPAPSPTKN